MFRFSKDANKMKKNKEASTDRWNDPVFVLNKLINVVIIILIIIGVAFLALFVFGIRPYVVLSGSMEPKIGTGSVVFVNQNAAFSELQKDDVITFRSGDMMVTHRVYEVQGDKIVTKGDANETPDLGYVTESSLVGKDVYAVPKLGFLVEFIQSWQGRIISGAIVVLLIVGSLLTGREKKPKENDA